MAKTWAEVVGSEGFQALSDAEKTTAREQYFDQVVAPQVPKGDLDLAREQFFSSTSLAPLKAAPAKEARPQLPAAGAAEAAMLGLGPEKKQSVLEGKQMPVEHEVRMGVRPEFITAVQAQLDALPADQREKALAELVKREDVYGRAARTIAERYGKTEQIQAPTLKKLADRRVEAGTERFIEQGLKAELAQQEAEKQALQGRTTPDLQQMTRDIVGEKADIEAAKQAVDLTGAGFWDRVGALSASRAAQTGMGLMQIYADVTGDKQFSKDLSAATRVEAARQGAIPQGEGVFEKSAQQAMASLATQAPMVLLSAMTGSPALALSQAGIDVFGNEYGQGRQQGLSAKEAATRAGLLASAEIVFERFGLAEELKAIRGALNKMPTDQIAGYLAKAISKEIPSEQLTSATQFLIDKTPGIGLNPNAGWKEFWENQAETLRQTILQSGAHSAGVIGTAKAAQAVSKALPEPGYQQDPMQELAYQMLARDKGFLVPTPKAGATTEEVTPPAASTATSEAVPTKEPVDTRIKQQDIDSRVESLRESTNLPDEDLEPLARRQLMEEAQVLGRKMPRTTAPTNRVEELTQEFIAAGEPPERAQQLATQQVQEEQDADQLAAREARIEQPVSGADRTSVPMVGQPSAVSPTPGAGVPEPAGVVSPGPVVAGIEGGEGVQPPALTFTTEKGSVYEVTPDGKTIRTKKSPGRGQGETYEPHTAFYVSPGDHTDILSDMQGGMGGNSVRLGYISDNVFHPIQDAAEVPEDGKAVVGVFDKKTNQPVGMYRASTTPAEGLHPVEKLYTPDGKSSTHVGNKIVSLQETPEEAPSEATQVPAAAAVQAAPAEEVETPPASVAPEVTPEAPKRGRGRPALAPEQKVTSEAARKQQRLDANQAKRNVDKAESLLQKSQEPLNENDYDNLDDLAEAQNVQRQQQQAAVRTLYQISRENKGKPGQRAAAILKAFPNQRFVQDAKTAYEYQKTQRISRSELGAEAIGKPDSKLGKVTTGAQAITQILKTGTDVQKEIARRIRGFVGDVKVVVLEEGQALPEQLQKPRNLRHWERARGLYVEDPATRSRTVYLRGESFGEDQGVNNVTVLHELLHAATNVKISQADNAIKRGFSTDSQLVRVYGDLVRTMNSAGQRFNELSRAGQLPEHISNLARYGNIFEDPREFVAYGMTDPDFQEFLMGAKGYEEDTSFFTKFVDTIRRFFKMSDDMVNALTDLMVVTDKILSAQLTPDMRLAEYGLPQVSAQAKEPTTEDEEAVRSAKVLTQDFTAALHTVTQSETDDPLTVFHAIRKPELFVPLAQDMYKSADRATRITLASMPTFDFLANWTKDIVPELTNTNRLLESMSGMSHQLLAKTGELAEDVSRAYAKDPKLAKKLSTLVYATTLSRIDPSDAHAREREARADKMFQELGPDGKRIYIRLRDYYKNLSDYYRYLLDQQLEKLDLPDDVRKNLVSIVKTVYEAGNKIAPYFPLVRIGNFWLRVGSGPTRQFYMFESAGDRDRFAEKVAKKRGFSSAALMMDAKKMRSGNDLSLLRSESVDSSTSTFLTSMFDVVDSMDISDPNVKEELKDAFYQIYLQTMPEQSFRRQFIHREGIAGFSTDLLRNINTTGARMSVQLARIKYAPLLRNSISQAMDYVQPTPENEPFVISARNRVNAALTAGRTKNKIDEVLNATAGIANKTSYIYYMSAAASALVQPFSVYISGLPILTAHHGPKAAKELAKMMTLINQYGIVRQNADGTRSYVAPSLANNTDLPDEERQAIRMMLARGVTQSSYASEVFGYKSTPSESLYFDPERGIIGNIPVAYGKGKKFANILMAGLMHNTERLSREAIYLASFRLSRAAGKSFDDAIDQAVADTNEALGNYDMTNRPLLMQHYGGKVLLQFKMYPLHTTLLLLTNLKRMMPFLNKEGKKEAAIKFFGILGTSYSVGGAVATPIWSMVMGLLGWAWKEFGKDKDAPEDLKSMDYELWFRTVWMPKHLDEDVAKLVEYGPLNRATGWDFSSRLSIDISNMWARDLKTTKTTREGLIAAAMSYAGPTANMILNLADARDAWNKGDTQKAAEKLAPAIVRSALIASRMIDEGITDYKGDRILSPGATKAGEIWGQAIGFRPALAADVIDKNFKFTGLENAIKNERNAVLDQLDLALRKGDKESLDAAYKRADEFHRAFPDQKIFAAINKSMQKREQRRATSEAGLNVRKEMLPIYGEGIFESRREIAKREKEAREKK